MIAWTWMATLLATPAGGAFAVYLLARLWPSRWKERRNPALASFTALILAWSLIAWGALRVTTGKHAAVWGSMASGGAFLRTDPGAMMVIGIALMLGLPVAVYSGRYLALDRRYSTYYPLLLLLITGLIGMSLAADLFNMYLFCELMSVSAYALVAFRRGTDTAVEAGFKYLIMGSVGTIAMLLGISFIYRQTGLLTLPQPAFAGPWGRAGTACVLIGMAIKSAIVPLHTWLPDAYGRAPGSISALLAAVVSKSTLYILVRVCLQLWMPATLLGEMLVWLAFLNMTLGNVMALVQTNTKRLLAYSSVAQTGYIMLGLGIGLRSDSVSAIQAAMFVLLVHAVMKAAAFLCKGVCHFYLGTTTVEELRGTSTQLPAVAAVFSLALAGLAGVPPLAGFAAKWSVLAAAIKQADALSYVGAGVFLLNSVVALGYYLPMIAALFRPAKPLPRPIAVSAWMLVPLLALGGLTIAIGIYPMPWLEWAREVGKFLCDMIFDF